MAGAAALSISQPESPAADKPAAPGIIDTNINLFDWPFRALKYRDTKALVAKIRKHRVIEAWAGSFEALLAKDMHGINARLAEECQRHGPGFLLPFGSVNIAWPDWQEDLRRCHETFRMRGIRIYPGYQPFHLNHPDFPLLLRSVSEHGLVLQIVFGMEDPRVHHPVINVGPVTLRPLVDALRAVPNAKVHLLHFPNSPQATDDLNRFFSNQNTFLEISRFEGNGAIGRMIGANPGLPSARAPLDRLLFGSHAPFFPIETAILKLIESPLESEQIRAIMQTNARQLMPR
jgi:predicted TIM-barrel fold metal-dependent hydrolase